MYTGRNFTRRAFQCGLYEAQDVLSAVDDVEMFHLETEKAYDIKESLIRRLIFHYITKKLVFVNCGLKPVYLRKEYELFLAVVGTMKDLMHINAVKGWKDHCKTSVCWIDELWASHVPQYISWLPLLKKFDYICVGLSNSVAALSAAVGRQCYYVPGAVDAVRFSPYPDPTDKVIDVYSIGRRNEAIHQVLLRLSELKKIFYVYDTFEGSMNQTLDCRQHRLMYADILKRSCYFIVAPAKMKETIDTRSQTEIGYRYYEGAAAGAVLIGQKPDCESYNTFFNWPDAVVEVKPDGSDTMEVISRLDVAPERLLEISRRNAMEVLLRHDWVYRWKQIYQIAGIKPGPSMEAREHYLKMLAAQIPISC